MRKHTLAGLLCILLGCGVAGVSVTYPIGKFTKMGPGFFPLFLAGTLIVLGLFLLFFKDGDDDIPIEWTGFWRYLRGWSAVLIGGIFFLFFIPILGLAISTGMGVFIICTFDEEFGLWQKLGFSFATAVIVPLVFVYGVDLPLPIFP